MQINNNKLFPQLVEFKENKFEQERSELIKKTENEFQRFLSLQVNMYGHEEIVPKLFGSIKELAAKKNPSTDRDKNLIVGIFFKFLKKLNDDVDQKVPIAQLQNQILEVMNAISSMTHNSQKLARKEEYEYTKTLKSFYKGDIRFDRLKYRLELKKIQNTIKVEGVDLKQIESVKKNIIAHIEIADYFKIEVQKLELRHLRNYEKMLADRAMDDLFDEEMSGANKASKKSKKKTSATKNAPPVKAKAPAVKENLTPLNAMPLIPAKKGINREALRMQYVENLYSRKHSFKLAKRVSRWDTGDADQIRQFADTKAGKLFKHYEHLNLKEIAYQQACHHLPLIENLLKSKDHQRIYSFKTERGFGMMAELLLEKQSHLGFIYFGIGENGALYHRYFEEKNFEKEGIQCFKDQVENDPQSDDAGQWERNSEASFSLRENGVMRLTVIEGRHEVNIFPVRPKLLDPRLI